MAHHGVGKRKFFQHQICDRFIMAKNKKQPRPKARLPRGFVDRSASDIRATDAMMATIKRVYESYGFDPVETPMFEFTDALGKFLPDTDRPNAGVFSLQDDDEQWMSLRYDLTAPLARHVAEQGQDLVTPYRTYRAGYVFRNEKPGPGRFRQFMQFDADIAGAPNVTADAEICMMLADALEAPTVDLCPPVVDCALSTVLALSDTFSPSNSPVFQS